MALKKLSQILYVYMNGLFVGTLEYKASRHVIFTYSGVWLEEVDSRPISLSMPLRESSYTGDVVYNYFNNLLPDSELIRERIQTRFQLHSNSCFDLLSEIGGDCVGALQLLSNKAEINIKKMQARVISDTDIASLLRNYKNAPLGMDKNTDFRISIAGAQEKSALLFFNKKWKLPMGATPTSHIIKLPIGKIEHSGIDLSKSVENEWLCLKILAAFGVRVSNAELHNFDSVNTLVVERFDRRWSEDRTWLMRLPQEDMCQALGVPPALKYESDGGPGIQDIMSLLQGSSQAKEDRYAFMKVNFLFWLLGAIDGHAKNFSIFIEKNGKYKLTPFYDVISAYPLAEKRQLEWKQLKMAMSVKGKNKHYHWGKIQPRHWLVVARACNFPESDMRGIMDDVMDSLPNVVEKVSAILPKDFPDEMAEAVFNGMRKLKEKYQRQHL